MIFRLSLLTLIVAVAGIAPHDAWARCEPDDYACAKFSNADQSPQEGKAPAEGQTRPQSREARGTRAGWPTQRWPPPHSHLRHLPSIPRYRRPVRRLPLHACARAPSPKLPRRCPTYSFAPEINSSASRREMQRRLAGRSRQCLLHARDPPTGADQRGWCRVHRVARACASWKFARSQAGGWFNEDSIALCGGRLLRRTELFPVAVDGQPQYALREVYKMLGGDSTCAAPYLRSRQPLRKAYLPSGARRFSDLQCGVVASR